MALIELDRDPPHEVPGRPANRWGQLRLRPVLLAIAVLLAAGLGAAAPAPGPLVPVASIPDAAAEDFTLAGGILYQAEPDPAVPGRIAAYRLSTGDRLWSVAVPAPVDLVLPVRASPNGTGVVLAQSFQATRQAAVSAVDPATGRLLWRGRRYQLPPDRSLHCGARCLSRLDRSARGGSAPRHDGLAAEPGRRLGPGGGGGQRPHRARPPGRHG
ncbi:MAG: hypothetical protein J2P15_11085 [Micromonosporaceae bacterium]|nr:hypothetical protein [Micromonosporaceae bacterium]